MKVNMKRLLALESVGKTKLRKWVRIVGATEEEARKASGPIPEDAAVVFRRIVSAETVQ